MADIVSKTVYGLANRGIYAGVQAVGIDGPYIRQDADASYLQLVHTGMLTPENCGVTTITSGVSNVSTLNVLLARSDVHIIDFNNPKGGVYLIDGPTPLFVPAGKQFILRPGCILGGSGTIIFDQSVPNAGAYPIFASTLTVQSSSSKISSGIARAEWWGAVGDGVTNNTVAAQAAANFCQGRCVLNFGAGTFRMDNVLIRCPIVGEGDVETILQRYTQDGSFILSAGHHPSETSLKPISNLCLDGELGVNGGVQFLNGGTQDNLAGHWHFYNVRFANCRRSVQKVLGNFGNVFTSCNFISGSFYTEYHYYALSDGTTMHMGLDTFYDCHFSGVSKAHFYIDDQQGGGTRFTKCVFEAYQSLAGIVKRYGTNSQILPLVFDNCWTENYTTYASVTIDGVTYSDPFDYQFLDTRSVVFRDCNISRINAQNSSQVRFEGCHHIFAYGTKLKWDADSLIEEFNSRGWQINSPALSDRNTQAATTGSNAIFRAEFPTQISNQYQGNLVFSNPLEEAADFPLTIGGGSMTVATVTDQVLNKTVIELTSITAADQAANCAFSPTAGKWVLIGMGVRKMSGAAAVVQDPSSMFYFSVAEDGWQYIWSYFKTSVNTGQLYVPNQSATLRMSSFQVLQFDHLIDLTKFLRSNVFVVSRDVESKYHILSATSDFNNIKYPRSRYIYRIFNGGDWYYDAADTSSAAVAGSIYVSGTRRFKLISGVAGFAVPLIKTSAYTLAATEADRFIILDATSAAVNLSIDPTLFPNKFIKVFCEMDTNGASVIATSGVIKTITGDVTSVGISYREFKQFHSDGTNLRIT